MNSCEMMCHIHGTGTITQLKYFGFVNIRYCYKQLCAEGASVARCESVLSFTSKIRINDEVQYVGIFV